MTTHIADLEQQAWTLIRAGLDCTALAGFVQHGSMAARIALEKIASMPQRPMRRAEARRWLRLLTPAASPTPPR